MPARRGASRASPPPPHRLKKTHHPSHLYVSLVTVYRGGSDIIKPLQQCSSCCSCRRSPVWVLMKTTKYLHGLAGPPAWSLLPPTSIPASAPPPPNATRDGPRDLSAPGSAFHLNTFSSQKFHFNLTSSLHTTLTPGNCLPNDPIKL